MSIPSWAVRGAKVVCVDASVRPLMGDRLVRRAVYTVQDTYDWFGLACVVLVEAKSDHPSVGYRLDRFRPVITEKDDLATHFEQYLKPDHRATRRVGEDA